MLTSGWKVKITFGRCHGEPGWQNCGRNWPCRGVWIDDCVELSRYIESKLDREEEDYELEVGSVGIGQPFKVLQQYLIHIGKEVEILTKEGKKLEGVLKDANEENFTVTIEKKVKPEGAKRPKLVEEDITFAYDEIKYTKYLISFK